MTSPSPSDGKEPTTPPAAQAVPLSADEPLPPAADEPLPPAGEILVSSRPATGAGTATGSATAAGAPSGDVPAGGNSFAAGFARQHFFSGARFLKPGRRVAVAVAGVAGVAAVAVGVAAGAAHFGGGDHDTVQSAASSSPLHTASGTPGGGPDATTPGQAPTTAAHHAAKPPAKPPAGSPGKAGNTGTTGGTGNATSGGSTGTVSTGTNTTTTTSHAPAAPPAKPPATSHPITFTGGFIVNFASSRCLASQGGSRSAGTQMVLADCDHSDPSQGWTFPSDGTARDFGGTMCLDVSNAGNGALVRLAACSAGRKADQAFVLKSSYDLVDVTPDLCVDAKDKATAAGTVLQTWTCGGTSNQKWRMP
jgi:hypothetical protein